MKNREAALDTLSAIIHQFGLAKTLEMMAQECGEHCSALIDNGAKDVDWIRWENAARHLLRVSSHPDFKGVGEVEDLGHVFF